MFNQVEVPDERSSTGTREIDFLVCGPNGVFVVESKNLNGSISGSEDSDNWTIHKVGRRGGAYSNSIRNPVRQVKTQMAVLSKYLRSRNINSRLVGIVTFSSNNDLSGVNGGSIRLTGTAALAELIRNYKPADQSHDPIKVAAAIGSLRASQGKSLAA